MRVLIWLSLYAGAACAAEPAVIAGRVTDAQTGQVVPATVTIRTSEGAIVTDHPSYRDGFRSSGEFEKSVPAGETSITVRRGFDYAAVERKVALKPGERREIAFQLRRRSPLREEGWYAGDSHAHMVHGERTIAVDFAYVALAARAEGLDYLSVAQQWNLPRVTPEDLDRACERASAPDFLMTWNLEAPKNYFRGDVSRCLGHGWTLGMRGRAADGRDAIRELMEVSAHDYESEKTPAPNFETHALIHSLGGIVSYSHPCRWWWGKWGGRGIYPLEERKFVSNMAAELPFDTLAGPTFDTLDVLMQAHEKDANECAQKLWFLLLDHGYRIPASGSSDATFDNPGRGVPGKVRVYTRVRGGLSLEAVADAMKAGRSFVTTGPLLVLEMDGHGSGDVVRLSRPRDLSVKIRAWGERLARIELIRNGEVVRTIDGGGRSELESGFTVREPGKAWYVARCYGADDSQIAITNPVWFEPPGSEPPAPALAHISVTVTDASTGKPLSGAAEVLRMVGLKPVTESVFEFRDGRFTAQIPAAARLRVSVPGYAPQMKSVFLDHLPLLNTIFEMRTQHLTGWAVFERIARLLRDVRFEFRLEKTR